MRVLPFRLNLGLWSILMLFVLVPLDAHAVMRSDSVIAQRMCEYGFPVSYETDYRLYTRGRDKFRDLFQDIREAKSYIHLQYYIMSDDSLNVRLFELLNEKRRQGVEVRLLTDAMGCMFGKPKLKKSRLKEFADSIPFARNNPLRFPWINHITPRDHRKIAIIDGRIVYIGGVNMSEFYSEGDAKMGVWHDTHLRLEGPVASNLNHVFWATWNRLTGEEMQDSAKYFCVMPDSMTAGQDSLFVINRVARQSPKAIRQLYVTMIDAAQHSVRILNPYVLPTRQVHQALLRALDRGVKVEIVISYHADEPIVLESSLVNCREYIRRGATLYTYMYGFNHSKLLIVDDVCASVGTANFDALSLRYNHEINLLLFSRPLVEQLQDEFEQFKSKSEICTPKLYRKRMSWKRFFPWVFKLARPFA